MLPSETLCLILQSFGIKTNEDMDMKLREGDESLQNCVVLTEIWLNG